jgi:hypothetical protein
MKGAGGKIAGEEFKLRSCVATLSEAWHSRRSLASRSYATTCLQALSYYQPHFLAENDSALILILLFYANPSYIKDKT